MGDLHHDPAPAEEFDFATSQRNARYGIVLFAAYLAFYAAFVLLNAFRPQTMDLVLAGVNLAIWYGLGLIVAAIFLAFVYVWIVRAPVAQRERRA